MRIVIALILVSLCAAAAGAAGRTPPYFTVGTELDVLPFATGGYYASLWAGYDGWRVRPVVARAYTPSFVVDPAFDDARVDALALIVDWFPLEGGDHFRGLWVGVGGEQWKNRIRREGYDEEATWDNGVATVGGGYVLKFWHNFYFNGWAAGHVVVAGDRDIPVAGAIYKQPTFTPEASLKIGWHF